MPPGEVGRLNGPPIASNSYGRRAVGEHTFSSSIIENRRVHALRVGRERNRTQNNALTQRLKRCATKTRVFILRRGCEGGPFKTVPRPAG